MRKSLKLAGLALALGANFALPAAAQVKPQLLVEQRQAKMLLQGKYFGPLAGMAQGKVPYDAKIAARNAGFLDALSKMAWDGFDPSTSGVKSRALPDIYKNPGKFKEAQEHFEGAVAKLVAATTGGNEAAVKAAIGDIGKSCGSCHQDFRRKE